MTDWNARQFMGEVERELAANIEKAAIYLKGKLKETVGVTGHPYRYAMGKKGPWYRNEDPSQPGYPPHKMLGDLQRSIAYQIDPSGATAYVGTNLDYGFYLEIGTKTMQARPWLRSTLMQEQETIARIVATGRK